jgi:hypothetical protein
MMVKVKIEIYVKRCLYFVFGGGIGQEPRGGQISPFRLQIFTP